MKDVIISEFQQHQESVTRTLAALGEKIEQTAALLISALTRGQKILTFGNGGSAADAQHFATELSGKYLLERPGLPVVALTTNASAITAISNDYGFEAVFARQIEALAKPEDVLFGITTSGTSRNILKALATGKRLGCKTVGLVGFNEGEIAPLCDILLAVPCREVPRIQEIHLLIEHILCNLIEKALAVSDKDNRPPLSPEKSGSDQPNWTKLRLKIK